MCATVTYSSVRIVHICDRFILFSLNIVHVLPLLVNMHPLYRTLSCPALPYPTLPYPTRPLPNSSLSIRSRSGLPTRGQPFEAPIYQEDDLSEETIAALISQLELAEATEVQK